MRTRLDGSRQLPLRAARDVLSQRRCRCGSREADLRDLSRSRAVCLEYALAIASITASGAARPSASAGGSSRSASRPPTPPTSKSDVRPPSAASMVRPAAGGVRSWSSASRGLDHRLASTAASTAAGTSPTSSARAMGTWRPRGRRRRPAHVTGSTRFIDTWTSSPTARPSARTAGPRRSRARPGHARSGAASQRL